MLSGIKLVNREDAERLAREERRQHKERKKEDKKKQKDKKSKHKKKGHDSSDGGSGGSSSGDEGGGKRSGGGGGRRRQQWDDPSSGGDSSGDDELGAGGGGQAGGGGGAVREDWMTKPAAARPKTDAQLAAEEEEREAKAAEERRRDPDAPFVSERELNPYFKDGGTGVPDDQQRQAAQAAAAAARRPVGVGDGGASWRMKALKRAQEQASEEGKKLNEIVSERWGSLTQLTAGLTEGRRAAHGMAHLHSARDRRAGDPEFEQRQAERRRMRGEEEGEQGGGRGGAGGCGGGREGQQAGKQQEGGGRDRDRDRAGYLSGMKSGRSQMQRPREVDSLSWRRDRDRGGSGGGRREGDGEPRQRQDGDRREERREGGRPGEERRDEGDRRDERSGGVGRGERGERGEREQQQQRRPGRDPLGRHQDAAVLKAAAAEINEFAGDGSFMEQFEQAAQQQAPQREGQEARPAAGAEVAPSASSGSSEDEGQQQQQQQRGRPSMAASMATERARLAARPAAAAVVAAAGREGTGGEGRPPGGGSGRGGGGDKKPAGGGNLSVAAMLRARLTGKAPPAPPPEAEGAAPAGRRHETVVLPQIDVRGRAQPGAFGREEAGVGLPDGGRKHKRVQRYEEGGPKGERSKYFADDDDTDLQTLMKRTKHGDEGDIDRRLEAGIMRSAKYKQADFDADAEYDHDAGLEMLDSRKVGKAREGQQQREKQRQVREYNKLNSALEQCRLCFSSSNRPRHLTLSIGQSSYLALPPRGRLVPGHCQIIPAEHVASTRQTDEQVWSEIRNFKKCLIQMFMKQGQEVVFFETAVQLGNMRSHAVVDCVPMPHGAAGRAPMFFRKAIDDATSEWAQHHAKRFIDTKTKGLRGSIPPNFPYLHVEFGISDGFVHVIDDEQKFERNLARNVMIGLLSLPQEDMHRRARQENPGVQQRWADDFRKQFEPFDWTKMLE